MGLKGGAIDDGGNEVEKKSVQRLRVVFSICVSLDHKFHYSADS